MALTALVAVALLAFTGLLAVEWATVDPPSAENDYQNLAGVGLIIMAAALVGAGIFVALTAAIGAATGFWSYRVSRLIVIVPLGVMVVGVPVTVFVREVVF